jgi:hypothetical protein
MWVYLAHFGGEISQCGFEYPAFSEGFWSFELIYVLKDILNSSHKGKAVLDF